MSSIKQIMRNRSLSRSSGGAKRIATSAIPKVDDKTLQTWVKSIDSAVKEVLKQSLTSNDLVNIGLVKFDNGKLTSLIPKEEEVNLTVPLAILNLSARGAYGSVTVIWNTPKSSLFGMNIVYRSELNDFGTAVQVGSTAGDVYTDYIGNNHKVYYWVRTVSKYGVEGHLSPSAYAATSIDIDYLLENLNEKIDESLLDQALRGKIADTADGLANEEQNRISEDLRVGLEITREAKERALAIANESKLLNQKIAEETQNLINQIENQSNTLSQDTINRVLALQEEIQGKINTLNNGITTETENRIDEDNAIASSLTAYKTSNNNAVSTVLSKAESAITANNALSSRLDALVASLTEGDGTTIDANAFNAMRAEVTTLNGTVSTLVEDVTALENSYSSALDLINTHGSAINTLQTKLTEMGNVVTQSANDITILKSDMGTVKNGLSTKAEAEAVENLETRVTKTEESQSALSRDVTNLSASITAQAVGDAITGTKDAINALKIVGDLSKVSLVDEPTATTGKVIRLGGNNGNDYLPATSNTFIPIRADRLYRIKYRFRRFAGTSNVYIGLICANSDKTKGITRTNQEKDIDLISSEMFAVSGLSPTTMQWVEGEFYFKGRSTSASTGLGTKESPMTYPAKASYMRLCLISGYLTGAGQYDFDYIILEDAEIIALNDAQASALSSTQAQVVEIDGRVKSSADDLTSLKGRVETAESSLTQKVDTSAMENIYTKTESDNAIAGEISSYNASLVIGGTNLLNNTMVLSNTSDTYRGGKIYRQTRTASQSDYSDFIVVVANLDAGDYTLSFDIKSSIDLPTMSSNLSYFFSPNNTTKIVTSQGYTDTNIDGRAEKRVTTSWQRIWITWTQSSATPAKNLIINRIYSIGSDYSVDIANIKFEKGNKATAWTPSDSDIQNELNANASAISQTNATVNELEGVVSSHSSSITSLSNKVLNLNTDTTNISNAVSILDSRIDSSDESIINQASNLVKLDAALKATTASDNLIPNPTFDSAYDQMGYTVVPSTNSEVPSNCPYRFVAKLNTRDNIPNIEDIACTTGDVYEISAYVACAQGTSNFNLMVVEKDFKSGNNIGFPSGGGLTPTSVWTKRVWRWTVRPETKFFRPFLQIDTFDNDTVWYATNWKVTNISAAAKAQSTADATASTLAATNATVSQLGDEIVANTQSIQAAESRISTNESSIQGIQNTYATKDSVGSLAQTALKSVWQNDINKAVSDISVGGVNLLSNTTYLSANNPPQVLGGSSYSLSGLNPNYHAGTSSTGENHFVIDNVYAERYMRIQAAVSNTSTLKPNSTYTFSVKIRGAAKPLGFRIIVRINGVFTDLPIKMIEYANDVYSTHGYTFTTPLETTDIIISLQSYSVNLGESFALQNSSMKLEEGNVVTAWTPSVSDVQAQIDASATAIQSTNTSVTNIEARISTQSTQLTQLSTAVNGYSATIQSHAESINGMRTQFTLKMDVNGLVSGIGMMNDGVTSDFIVNANTFAIGSPTSNFRPFIATSTETIINGVPAPAGVHINTALIANGTIKNAQIGDLSADKITTGDIHADRMKANIVKAVEGQFDNLGAITAKIGHLRTADTGARIEFKGNLLSFFDNDDTGVILIGEWEEDPIGG